MPKVGIYCRLSIEDRDKAESDSSASIQNQKAMLRDHCRERVTAVLTAAAPSFGACSVTAKKGTLISCCAKISRDFRAIL